MTDELKVIAKKAVMGDGPTPEEARVLGKVLFTYGWRASAFAFAMWSLGTLDNWNLGSGFAYAAETKTSQLSVDRRLTAIERRLLEGDIMETFKESCAAPTKQYFTDRLNALQNDYSEKIGRGQWMRLPNCDALGIKPHG